MARQGFTSGDTAEASENLAQKGELEEQENAITDASARWLVGFCRGESEPVMLVIFCSGETRRYRGADLRVFG